MTSLARHCYALIASLGLLLACGGADSGDGPKAGAGFESDDPSGGPGGPGNGSGGATATGGSGGAGATGGSDAADAIEEADIIKLEGNRLYALSQYSGLSVIDVTNPDALKLLGRHELQGEPFEMYVLDGVVLAMYSSLPEHVQNAGGYTVHQMSGVVALNAKSPGSILQLNRFTLPGEISDSRLVGNVLYAVSHQNGYCWGCNTTETTTVLSLDVSDPSQVVKVDELAFSAGGSSNWGKRTVMATAERIYIAGREWSGKDASTIQVVDIGDKTGKLVKGAAFEAVGEVESRWQLDERDGVLRVISQPGSWQIEEPPHIQTFTVESSHSFVPLADVPMVLPRPERLRSVRFDGTRGYAITFEQTDPLFVIDFTDPALPVQLGELEIPGWVYHMEPRGDRLLALGFDQGNAEGSLNVSLFDVADMTQPTMLKRVHFGGTGWGQFAEDQNRIHKAFTIVDALGLIFVPFSGWSYELTCGSWSSGIQIVEFDQSTLTKRGVAPSQGTARRAFLHQSRLFAVSDASVETFDITDRDTPKGKSHLWLATTASETLAAGDKVVRLAANWWTARPRLDVTTLAGVTDPEPLASIALEEILPGVDTSCGYGYSSGWQSVHARAHGSQLSLLTQGPDRRLAVVDVAQAPLTVSSVTALPSQTPEDAYYLQGYYSAVQQSGESTVQTGSRLALLRPGFSWSTEPNAVVRPFVDIVNLQDPKNPKVTTFELPESLGVTGLVESGGVVALSRWVPSPTSPGKVRFYVERFDLTGAEPKHLPPVNVPGSLFAAAQSATRVTTVDYTKVVEQLPPYKCYEKWGHGAFVDYGEDYTQGSTVCHGTIRTLKQSTLSGTTATVHGQLALASNSYIYQAIPGGDRVYARNSNGGLWVFSGVETGALAVDAFGEAGWVSHFAVDGPRLVTVGGYPSELVAYDVTNPASVAITQRTTLRTDARHLTVVGKTGLVSLGQYGVEVVALP